MGQNKATAIASRDWDLFLADAIDDLLTGWDNYSEMAGGASEVDRENARSEYRDRCAEWDGSAPTVEAQNAFADRYDSALRAKAIERAGS